VLGVFGFVCVLGVFGVVGLVSSAFTEVVSAAKIARLSCERLRNFKIFSKGYRVI